VATINQKTSRKGRVLTQDSELSSATKVGAASSVPRRVLLCVLLLLVLLAPWGRGLFWTTGRVGFAIIVLAVGLGALLTAKRVSLTVADMAGLGVVGLYAIGMITPATRFGAALGLISWAGYIGVYLMWRGIEPSDSERELLSLTAIVSATVAALIGILTYAGVIYLQFQLAGDRIGAAFEYPNATASFFLVAIVLAMHRSFYATTSRVRRVLSVSTVLLIAALVLTLSRGGWLALLLFVPLMLWVGRRSILQMLYHFGMLGMLGLLGAVILMTYRSPMGVLGALIVALLAYFVVEPPKVMYRAVQVATLFALSLAVLLVIAVVASILTATPSISQGESALSVIVDRFVPPALAGRIAAFSFDRLVADGRLVFFQDGVAIFRQSPLLGSGGGAWEAMYHQAQSFLYGTRRIHSDPYEIALEVGLLGLLCVLVLIGGPLKALPQLAGGDVGVALVLAGTLMFAHSFIEALLAFPALYVILFALLGAAPQRAYAYTLSPRSIVVGKAVGSLAGMAVLVLAAGIFLAQIEASSMGRAARRGEVVDTIAGLRRMQLLSPWDTAVKTDLALQLWPQAQHRREVESLLVRSRQLDPHDPRLPNLLGQFRLQGGQHEAAMELFQEAVRLQPKNEQTYAMLAAASADGALYFVGDLKRKQRFIDLALATERDFHAMAKEAGPLAHATGGSAPVMTENFRLALAKVAVLAGDEGGAAVIEQVLRTTGDESLRIMSAMWHARMLEMQGRKAEAEAVMQPFHNAPGVAEYRARLARIQ